MKRLAFLFPGQGAQVVGMGKDFFDSFVEAKDVFQEANSILSRDLSSVIFNGPEELLVETKNSQSGIFVTSLAILRVLEKQFRSLIPKVTSGLSLGEYTAIVASKRLGFSEALKLVEFRGLAMNDACLKVPGTMAAIFGLSNEAIEELASGIEDLWVANYNCPGQTVISGTHKGVEAGIKAATERGAKRAIPLKVHGAFHSGLMKSAEERLKAKIDEVTFIESDIALVMNVPGDFVRETAAIKNNLISQVTKSVRWEQGVRAMADEIDLFIEIGCGKTLAGLNRQIGVKGQTVTINKIADLETLAGAL